MTPDPKALPEDRYIRHEDDEWVVYSEDGKVLGKHKTKAEAEAQLAAVEANKHKEENSAPPPPNPLPVGERRTGGKVRVEVREKEDGTKAQRIVGHAAVFNEWCTLYSDDYGEMRERVNPSAFARAIREKQDVRALFNHDSNIVLGRTTAGTLTLSADRDGLVAVIDPPTTQTVRDLVLTPIDRGDVSGMSFAFDAVRAATRSETENDDGSTTFDRGGDRLTVRYEGKRQIIERELVDVDLFDVSPVTYPAYEGTDCSLRNRSVPDIETLVREVRSSVRRPAPKREEHRRKLGVLAARLASTTDKGSADPGRKGSMP